VAAGARLYQRARDLEAKRAAALQRLDAAAHAAAASRNVNASSLRMLARPRSATVAARPALHQLRPDATPAAREALRAAREVAGCSFAPAITELARRLPRDYRGDRSLPRYHHPSDGASGCSVSGDEQQQLAASSPVSRSSSPSSSGGVGAQGPLSAAALAAGGWRRGSDCGSGGGSSLSDGGDSAAALGAFTGLDTTVVGAPPCSSTAPHPPPPPPSRLLRARDSAATASSSYSLASSVFEQLFADASAIEAKKALRREELAAASMAGATFAPAVNANSGALAERRWRGSASLPPFSRPASAAPGVGAGGGGGEAGAGTPSSPDRYYCESVDGDAGGAPPPPPPPPQPPRPRAAPGGAAAALGGARRPLPPSPADARGVGSRTHPTAPAASTLASSSPPRDTGAGRNSVTERLYADARLSAARLAAKRAELAEAQARMAPHVPAVNPTSRALAAGGGGVRSRSRSAGHREGPAGAAGSGGAAAAPDKDDVFNRLYSEAQQFQAARARAIAAVVAAQRAQEVGWGTPAISDASRRLARAAQGVMAHLADHVAASRASSSSAAASAADTDRGTAGQPPAAAAAAAAATATPADAAAAAAEHVVVPTTPPTDADTAAAANPRPAPPAPPASGSSAASVFERLYAEAHTEAALAALRRDIAAEWELAGCTFRPSISSAASATAATAATAAASSSILQRHPLALRRLSGGGSLAGAAPAAPRVWVRPASAGGGARQQQQQQQQQHQQQAPPLPRLGAYAARGDVWGELACEVKDVAKLDAIRARLEDAQCAPAPNAGRYTFAAVKDGRARPSSASAAVRGARAAAAKPADLFPGVVFAVQSERLQLPVPPPLPGAGGAGGAHARTTSGGSVVLPGGAVQRLGVDDAAGVARGSGALHARLYAEGVARLRAAAAGDAVAATAAARPRTGTMPATPAATAGAGARLLRPASAGAPRERGRAS
jgi:hypothetical protein